MSDIVFVYFLFYELQSALVRVMNIWTKRFQSGSGRSKWIWIHLIYSNESDQTIRMSKVFFKQLFSNKQFLLRCASENGRFDWRCFSSLFRMINVNVSVGKLFILRVYVYKYVSLIAFAVSNSNFCFDVCVDEQKIHGCLIYIALIAII